MGKTEKKERKKMSPKAKKIANIIVTSLQVAIVVVTVVISIFVWTTTGKGEASDKAFQILAIRSNSMKGDNPDSFNSGDLVIIKRPEDAAALTVGTVVTYKYAVSGGGTTLITHRINEILEPGDEGGNIRYATKGDNAENVDAAAVQPGDIVGVYSFKLKGLGTLMLWLQGYERVELGDGDYGWDYAGNTNNFLWVIIIPLIALLLWNGYAMIKVIMEGKLKKAREEAAAAAAAANGSASAVIDEEEIKRRAIEEYLAKQQGGAVIQTEAPKADPEPEQKEDSETELIENSPLAKGGLIAAESGNGGFDNSNAQPEQSSEAQPENSPLAKGGSIAAESGNGGFDNANAQPEQSSEAQPENSPFGEDSKDQPKQNSEELLENTPKMATRVDIEGEEKRSEKAQLSTLSREQAKSDSLDDLGVLEDPEAQPVAKKPAAKPAPTATKATATKKPAATTAKAGAAKKPASTTAKAGAAIKTATTAKKPAATKTTAATKTSTAKKPAATKPKE